MASRKTRGKIAAIENVDVSIERWQAGTIVQKADETGAGPIASLFNSLIELLGLILIAMKSQSNISRHYRSLESSSAALFFWGVDLDVSQGELDEALRDSPELRDTCLMVLASIGHFTISSLVGLVTSKDRQKELLHSTAVLASLEQANNILDQPYYPRYKTEQDEESLWCTLRSKIDHLVILGPSLASPAEETFDEEEPRTVEHDEEHIPEQAFINSIAQRFPQAAIEVVTRLGQLNWERQHIFDDILAYACPFAGCSLAETFFQDRHAMMDHLEQYHDLDVLSDKITCPICIEYSSNDRNAFSLHVSRHMEEIALAILPSAIDSDHESADNTFSEAKTDETEREFSPDRAREKQSHSNTSSKHDNTHLEPRECQSTAGLTSKALPSHENDAVSEDSSGSSVSMVQPETPPQLERSTHRALTSPAFTMSKTPVDRFGATRLARESEKGDLDAVKAAYTEAPNELNQVDYAGIAPLQKASLHGWADVVRYLVAKGCDTACESNDRDTPLIDAAENGHLDVVKILLEANLDPHYTNKRGQRAIDVLDYEDDDADEIERLLRDAMRNYVRNDKHSRPRQSMPMGSPTQLSPSEYNVETPARLLSGDYNIETLLEKTSAGDVLAVRELIDSGIKPNLDCAFAALKRGYDDFFSMFLAAGLESDRDHAEDEQALMTAAIYAGRLEIVGILVNQKGFDPTRRDREGKTYHEYAENKRWNSNWKEIRDILESAFKAHQRQTQEQPKEPHRRHGMPQLPPSIPPRSAPAIPTFGQDLDASTQSSTVTPRKHKIKYKVMEPDNRRRVMSDESSEAESDEDVISPVRRVKPRPRSASRQRERRRTPVIDYESSSEEEEEEAEASEPTAADKPNSGRVGLSADNAVKRKSGNSPDLKSRDLSNMDLKSGEHVAKDDDDREGEWGYEL